MEDLDAPTCDIISTPVWIIADPQDSDLEAALAAALTTLGLTVRPVEDSSDQAAFNFMEWCRVKSLTIVLATAELPWSHSSLAKIGAAKSHGFELQILCVPPVTAPQVWHTCPLLGDVSPQFVMTLLDTRQYSGEPSISREKISNSLKRIAISAIGDPSKISSAKLENATRSFQETLESLLTRTEPKRPPKRLLKIWDSIKPHSHAQRSIIDRIKDSLGNGSSSTSLIFVGISLKYSLVLITEALREYVDDINAGRRIRAITHPDRRKQLEILLVHMDDFSHILNSINNDTDKASVRMHFGGKWPDTLRDWSSLCESVGVDLQCKAPKVIDYLPPRTGILIDRSVLYASRCAYQLAGAGVTLLAGELEYIYYDLAGSEPDAASSMIRQFLDLYQVYGNPSHNGGLFANGTQAWLKYIEECLEHRANIREATFISQSGSRLDHLILKCAQMGINVKVYVQSPRLLWGETRKWVQTLQNHYHHCVSGAPHARGRIKVYEFDHISTFRAAILGSEMIAFQAYGRVDYTHGPPNAEVVAETVKRLLAGASKDDDEESLVAPLTERNASNAEELLQSLDRSLSNERREPEHLEIRVGKAISCPLCVLVTRNSSQYERLSTYLTGFLLAAGVSGAPAYEV